MSATQIRVRGTLVAASSLHVGAEGAGLATDRPLVRGGAGEPVIPGTTMAGALRRQLVSAGVEPNDVDWWFGDDGDETTSMVRSASRIVVDDAYVAGGTAADDGVEVRTSVALDPDHGAPKLSALHSLEVVPAGTTFTFSLEVDGDVDPQKADDFLAKVITLLRSGIVLGAGTSRGMGLVRLDDDVERLTVPLGDRKKFLAFLADPVFCEYSCQDRGLRPNAFEIGFELAFCAVGPMMSSVEVDGGVNRAPLTTGVSPGNVRLVLPGSGVKGALRARARYVLRTLGCTDPEADDAFQLLFGVPRTDEAPAAGDIPGRGRLRFHDVLSTVDIASATWREVLDPDEGEGSEKERRAERRRNLKTSLESLGPDDRFLVSDHVAIDRWTGGGASGRLYSLLAPEVAWTPLRVDLDLHQVDPERARRAIGLLLLVLREVMDGWVPLGHGTRRGFGQIEVDSSASTVSVGAGLPSWRELSVEEPCEASTVSFDAVFDRGSQAAEAAEAAVTAFVLPHPPVGQEAS